MKTPVVTKTRAQNEDSDNGFNSTDTVGVMEYAIIQARNAGSLKQDTRRMPHTNTKRVEALQEPTDG